MRRKFKTVAGLAATVLLLACGMDATIHPNVADAQVTPLSEYPDGAEVVTVGVYPVIVDALDISASTYDLTAYIWMKWNGPIDPTEHLEFANAVTRYDFYRENLYDAPVPTPDGGQYQVMQVHGKFFQPYELEDFPFDRQSVSLLLQDEYRAHENLVYVPDEAESGFAADLEIPGWEVLGWRAQPILRDYGSRFGAPDTHLSTTYPGIRFELVLTRHVNYFVWKLFLPLCIVLAANWMALLIDPELVDVRTALPATSLLTLVFLQQSYSAELPEIGTLVFMDKIYAMAFLVVIATLVEVIATASWKKSSADVTDARISRIDHITLTVQIGVFAGVVGTLLLAL